MGLYRDIVNCQTRARNSRKESPSRERCDGRFPNRLTQKHDFSRVSLLVFTRQGLLSGYENQYRYLKTFQEQFLKNYRWTSQQWNCSLTFYVLFLFEDSDPATKRSLVIDVCICLNNQERRSLASLSTGSRRWNYEVLFYMHIHGTHDQIMCLIFLFLDQFPISEILYA